MEEIIDLYDKHMQKLEQTWVRSKTLPENTFRYVVHVCVFNSNGEMLIQRRAEDGKKYSHLWDITLGGGVKAGDTPQQAATRELEEELGYFYDFSQARPVLTVHFDKGFDDYYILNEDVDLSKLTLQKEEVCDVKWASEKQIFEMIKSGEFIPYKPSIIEFLFASTSKMGAIFQ